MVKELILVQPLILEQDQGKQAPFVYIGSYEAAAERINLLAGGKLIAETGRQDKPALAVACVVLLAHCLLLFFLNEIVCFHVAVFV